MKCEICSSGYAEQNLKLCRTCLEAIFRLWKLTFEGEKPADNMEPHQVTRHHGAHVPIAVPPE